MFTTIIYLYFINNMHKFRGRVSRPNEYVSAGYFNSRALRQLQGEWVRYFPRQYNMCVYSVSLKLPYFVEILPADPRSYNSFRTDKHNKYLRFLQVQMVLFNKQLGLVFKNSVTPRKLIKYYNFFFLTKVFYSGTYNKCH